MIKGKRIRREGALERLVGQLKSNEKPEKINGKETGKKIKLTDKDKSRIEKEINILKNRV